MTSEDIVAYYYALYPLIGQLFVITLAFKVVKRILHNV